MKDLDGKKVAFTSPKSVTDMLLTMIADKYHIKMQTVAAGGIGAGLTMVEQKAVVAAPVMDPIWPKVQGKMKPVFFIKDELPNMVQSVGVTTVEYAKANGDKLRKLVQARKKAVSSSMPIRRRRPRSSPSAITRTRRSSLPRSRT